MAYSAAFTFIIGIIDNCVKAHQPTKQPTQLDYKKQESAAKAPSRKKNKYSNMLNTHTLDNQILRENFPFPNLAFIRKRVRRFNRMIILSHNLLSKE